MKNFVQKSFKAPPNFNYHFFDTLTLQLDLSPAFAFALESFFLCRKRSEKKWKKVWHLTQLLSLTANSHTDTGT